MYNKEVNKTKQRLYSVALAKGGLIHLHVIDVLYRARYHIITDK